jgi:hypothetical protein
MGGMFEAAFGALMAFGRYVQKGQASGAGLDRRLKPA